MIRTTISLICLVAAGAIFFMYTQPTYDTVQATNTQIAQYDQALSKATELQSLKQTLLSRYNAFNPADIARLQTLLPDHVDNVRLILDIDSLAGKHGMALQNVVVSAPASAQGNQTAVGAVGASSQKYDSLTIKFTTQGSYDTFRQFLSDLDSSLRIVDLTSLMIAPGAGSSAAAATSSPLYTYTITLQTYWLK
jgi:Tfp pilus assembly protein PilO